MSSASRNSTLKGSAVRERVRPTREETRRRLFEAATRVFEERGIGAASIEAIAEAAGFTRGAFYSNFATKDELIIAMLADHVEQTSRRNLELLTRHRDPADFVAALRAMDRTRQDPLGRSPVLHMELILHAARTEDTRPQLAERLRARRALVAQIVLATSRSAGRTVGGFDADQVAAMLLALEDGYRLHRLIDPESTPDDAFLTTVSELQGLLDRSLGRSADGTATTAES